MGDDECNFHEYRENQQQQQQQNFGNADGFKNSQKDDDDICKGVSKGGEQSKSSKSSKSSNCKCKPKSKSNSRSKGRRKSRKTIRTTNPFLVFYLRIFFECRKKNQPVTEVARMAGKKWCQMTDKQKEKYIQIARAEKERRQRMMKRRGKC